MFCGVFDGHGPWGHFVARSVRESLPSSLLCNWQKTLALTSLDSDFDLESDKKVHSFDVWKQSYLRTCAVVDKELEQHRGLDSFYSGTTALTVVKQVMWGLNLAYSLSVICVVDLSNQALIILFIFVIVGSVCSI